jgi:hypothetical protein
MLWEMQGSITVSELDLGLVGSFRGDTLRRKQRFTQNSLTNAGC